TSSTDYAVNEPRKCATRMRGKLMLLLSHYFSGRDWPLPMIKEFNTVKEFNELLAWVLIFGRRPNHFTLSIHLLPQFANLNVFLAFISQETAFDLNQDGGIVKGGGKTGIAQGSTMGTWQKIKLQDGEITIRSDFVEFVWRYPRDNTIAQP